MQVFSQTAAELNAE